METPHELAERALVSHVHNRRLFAGDRSSTETFATESRARAEGSTWALEALGVISASEGEHWRRRILEAGLPPDQRPKETLPAATRETAEATLEQLLVDLEPGGRDANDGHSSDSLNRFEGALMALTATGVLDPSEEERWDDRSRARLGIETRAEEAAADWKLNRAHTCTAEELLAIVPGPPQRLEGVRITSLELYADGLRVNWHHRDGDCGDLFMTGELADDVGTEYWAGGGGGSGLEEAFWGECMFSPCPPAEARTLEVTLGPSRFSIPLPERKPR